MKTEKQKAIDALTDLNEYIKKMAIKSIKTRVTTLVVKQVRPTRNQLCPCGIKCKNCPEHKKFLDKKYKPKK